ncbi:hypothetical protein D3Z50_11730, partial [Clostridiaceae bacterium]|nr:hypothetical protein [Clostridiaceae bacterium]
KQGKPCKIRKFFTKHIYSSGKLGVKRVMLTYEEGYNAGIVEFGVEGGILEIELPPAGAAVLAAEKYI